MALVKCPRCELNYMNETDKYCAVCKRELHGEEVRDDAADICPECGENPIVPGEELCYVCLREIARHTALSSADDTAPIPAEDMLDPASVSGMDEIEIVAGDDIPEREYKEIDQELGDDSADELLDGAIIVDDSLEALAEDEDEDEEEEDI